MMRPAATTVRPWARATVLIAAGFAAQAAAGTLSLEIDEVRGHGIALQGIRIALEPAGDAFGGRISVDSARLPEPLGTVRELGIECPRLTLSSRRLRCSDARATAPIAGLTLDDARLTLELDFDGGVDARIDGLDWHGMRVDLIARRDETGRWRLDGSAGVADAATTLDALADRLPEGFGASGGIDLSFRGTLHPDGELQMHAVAALAALGGHGLDGRHAAENLGGHVNLSVQGPLGGTLQLTASARIADGQAYVEPVFLDFAQHPVSADVHLSLDTGTGTAVLTHLSWRDPGALTLLARGAVQADGSGELAIERVRGTLPGLYDRYLQPFLVGGAWDALDTAGTVDARGRWRDGRPQALQLHLERVYARDRRDRLVLSSLHGEAHWDAAADAPVSWLSWQGGRLYDLDFGASRLDIQLHADGLSASEDQRVALLDGALVIRGLRASGLGTAAAEVAFDARLEPIGLERLSRALGWPAMGGTLAGTLPGARYRNRVITAGGALEVAAFDGAISVDNLRIEELISPLPRLSADVRLRRLDLEQLTGTFEVGRITGRLDGEVLGLRLLDWRPSAFDARLYTAAEPGRRRISQRAVDNLSSVGGGGGALPSLFMRFFEDFSYDSLGLSCRLVNDVCHMDGVAPTNGNYYIVRGRGLPRIDVIGSVRQVSWPALVQQLGSVQFEDPVVR